MKYIIWDYFCTIYEKKDLRIMKKLYAVVLLSLCFGPAQAKDKVLDEISIDSKAKEKDSKKKVKLGSQKITKESIENQATGNGSLTDLLKSNPSVTFSNANNTSEAQGEISPANVSFHGEKFYNNSFLIDGLSNNDNTNPGGNGGYLKSTPNGYSANQLPDGNPQSFWVSSDLIDSVEVHDSNISAKYGQFTGGVVNAKLKDPDIKKQSGSISYRTTRSTWTKFNIFSKPDDFNAAEKTYSQPKFTKNIYTASINYPIDRKTAILLAYNRTEAKIPHYDSALNTLKDQSRLAENYISKTMYTNDKGNTLRLTAMSAPHSAKYYKKSMKDGAFTVKGGGHVIAGEHDYAFNNGSVKTTVSYKQTENISAHEKNDAYTWSVTPSVDWTTSARTALEGGYGTWGTTKKTTTIKQEYTLDTINKQGAKHNFLFGWKVDMANAGYNRTKESSYYMTSVKSASTICNAGDTSCITGEQYLRKKRVYTKRKIDVSNNHYSAYAQDMIKVKHWEITPGVRIDKDQFLKNTNIAPRFMVTYDVENDKMTRIFGGVNRYYADSMLSYALRDKIGSYDDYSRTSSTGSWVKGRTRESTSYGESNLKTPYSDEINMGVTHQRNNNEWTVKVVQRMGKDQFAQSYVSRVKSLNNNGRSKSTSISVSGKPIDSIKWNDAIVSWSVGANYSQNTSNFNYYDDRVSPDTNDDKIIVDGKLIDFINRPANDFNKPWRVQANLNMLFPKYNVNWNQSLSYTAGYYAWKTATVDCPDVSASICGAYTGQAKQYSKEAYGNALNLNWRVSVGIPTKTGDLKLDVDVFNVLNSTQVGRSGTSSSGVSYKPGRSFWLGLRYSW